MKKRYIFGAAVLALAIYQINGEMKRAETRDQRLEAEAVRLAQKSVEQSKECLSGKVSEGYNLANRCRMDWSPGARVTFYKRLLHESGFR